MRTPFFIFGILLIIVGLLEMFGKENPRRTTYRAPSTFYRIKSKKAEKIISTIFGLLLVVVGLYTLFNGILWPSQILWIIK